MACHCGRPALNYIGPLPSFPPRSSQHPCHHWPHWGSNHEADFLFEQEPWRTVSFPCHWAWSLGTNSVLVYFPWGVHSATLDGSAVPKGQCAWKIYSGLSSSWKESWNNAAKGQSSRTLCISEPGLFLLTNKRLFLGSTCLSCLCNLNGFPAGISLIFINKVVTRLHLLSTTDSKI